MAASEVSDGPVLSLMNKRLRALRKKHNRILQLEDNLAQGKPLNKEQEDLLRSKPAVSVLIDEYEKLRQPLSLALHEELSISSTETNKPQSISSPPTDSFLPHSAAADDVVEDLVKLVYFGCLFDVKPQSEFTSTMLTRIHERGCCLTYDYVTDDATADLLGERDLDLISMLGGLVTSRPVHSGVSHKNALFSCVEHAKLWLSSSDQPVQPGAAITYAGLRERLNKILASDYFTTTPEMKAPVDVAAAAGKYTTSQVPVQDSTVAAPPSPLPALGVEGEGALGHYEHKDEEITNIEGNEAGEGQSTPVDEPTKVVDEEATRNTTDGIGSEQQDQQNKAQADAEHDERGDDGESKDQQYVPRRAYQNARGGGRGGGGGGRRGYPNGRGGRGGRGGGGSGYQNGRNQYYDQGNYYPRNYHNARGRGGGKGVGATMYSNHGGGGLAHSGHGPANVELGSAS
eukprot:TRINITY_DN1378_c0_g1_i2.p1 TRINITY_DN1378_c0_g1~~TRINITY_DN1378_c0_g1_i2.p1  ORF type:complete len:458 (-),score=61.67 TRINITY_DN1378_c0_g1_i2:307-1680(-)